MRIPTFITSCLSSSDIPGAPSGGWVVSHAHDASSFELDPEHLAVEEERSLGVAAKSEIGTDFGHGDSSQMVLGLT